MGDLKCTVGEKYVFSLEGKQEKSPTNWRTEYCVIVALVNQAIYVQNICRMQKKVFKN